MEKSCYYCRKLFIKYLLQNWITIRTKKVFIFLNFIFFFPCLIRDIKLKKARKIYWTFWETIKIFASLIIDYNLINKDDEIESWRNFLCSLFKRMTRIFISLFVIAWLSVKFIVKNVLIGTAVDRRRERRKI